MKRKHLIFIGGLHRSGTSLLHELLRSHPEVSGFKGTGAPEDEGQHLQSVYPSARAFGGPGRFGLDESSFMDERHPLAGARSARKIYKQWSRHWDTTRKCLIEKSPPNLVRTRFLQKLFPESSFVIIFRHPIAVSYATRRRFTESSIPSLIEHCLICYERFFADRPFLRRVYVLRYEEFVSRPQETLADILAFAGLDAAPVTAEVRTDVNEKYIGLWEEDYVGVGSPPARHELSEMTEKLEPRMNGVGYSLEHPRELLPVDFLGPHVEPPRRGALGTVRAFGRLWRWAAGAGGQVPGSSGR